jgi:hypothetical protein
LTSLIFQNIFLQELAPYPHDAVHRLWLVAEVS